MFVAVDKQGNRLYAEDEEKHVECFCPACGEPLKHKKGKVRRPYFAHLPNSVCHFGQDKDYKSEWHIRMQEYFPKEEREYLFVDEETGEKHIADVFVKEANTVLEFQHSPIDEQEFISRTYFHLKNKRRIVWLFDESSEKEGGSRFIHDESAWSMERWPYDTRTYKWRYRRRSILKKGPPIAQYQSYSVCVYTGTEGDMFHRIVAETYGFEYVTFSLHNIELNEHLDIEEFFRHERYWQEQEPWKSIFEERIQAQKRSIEEQRRLEREQADRAFQYLLRNPPRRKKR